jgi:hypothetical protein
MINVSNDGDVTDMVHRPNLRAGKMPVGRVIVKWVQRKGHKGRRTADDSLPAFSFEGMRSGFGK